MIKLQHWVGKKKFLGKKDSKKQVSQKNFFFFLSIKIFFFLVSWYTQNILIHGELNKIWWVSIEEALKAHPRKGEEIEYHSGLIATHHTKEGLSVGRERGGPVVG
jgi:hypothetical protein